MAVHWGVKEDGIVRFQYGVADREELVRNAVLGAAREMLGGASINTVFTTDRRWFEEGVERLAQIRLEDYVSGIRIHSFRFIDTHAPSEVHASFRDVASALEDRSTAINRARGHEAQLLPKARGEAATAVAVAKGYAARTVARAVGEADRFLSLLRAYAASPEIMRQRLEFETLEKVWPKLKKYITPPSGDKSELEIWFLEQDAGKMPRLVPGT
jgi:membrane protease subunit HflK